MKRGIPVAVAVTLMVGVAPILFAAEHGGPQPSAADLARKYAGAVLSLTERGDHRDAISKAADYELDLLGLYPPPSYEMGLFQSEAEHISFHCPFLDWKRVDLDKQPELKKLAMVGWNFLFSVEGGQQENMVVVCLNVKQVEQRIGSQGQGPDFCSDQGLQMMAQMLAGNFGVVKAQEFRSVGDHRILFLKIRPPMMGPDVRLALLPKERRVFAFLLITPTNSVAANEARLDELIKTASFDYSPEDASAIAAQRRACDRQDVRSLLDCVERLSRLGEYYAAAEDLAELRLLVHRRLPAPAVEGDVGSCPAFGLVLRNPDPNKWALSTIHDGILQGIVLQDKFSVNEEGIMVAVLDLLMAYGPQVLEMMNKEEAVRKDVLIGAGRGGGMMLGEIKSERLASIKGDLAYEAVISPNMPGLKARVQYINKSDHALVIMLLASEQGFDAAATQCDQILANNVQLRAGTSTRATVGKTVGRTSLIQ